jgi:signal transduction histidine kinase
MFTGIRLYTWRLIKAKKRLESIVEQRTAEVERQKEQLLESLDKLQKTQRRLAEASHRAGMAEVASSVLHNVGNALNSVNTTSFVVSNKLRDLNIDRLFKVVGLLKEHEADLPGFFTTDPKSAKIPQFLDALAQSYSAAQSSMSSEMTRLQDKIENITSIVAAQQEYANAKAITETISLAELFNSAVEMSNLSLKENSVQITREFASMDPVRVETFKVVQILVHLLNNAEHALSSSEVTEKRLVLQIKELDQDKVRLAVIDNGIGIPKDNINRIFTYGFSTKEGGRGLGLHSAANSANAMGGSLSCHSDGPGQGAVFYLDLPLSIRPG